MMVYGLQVCPLNSNIGIHIKWCGLPNGNDANNAVNMGVVTFALAEDGKTIQFNNPYGNVCFWHAIRV